MLKYFKPTTQSRRKMSVTDYSSLAKKRPEKSLLNAHKMSVGRDKTGQISTRHKGGGEKRKYRLISSLDAKSGVKATVEAIEYDPFRSSFIALVKFEDGIKAYLVAWEGSKIGDVVIAEDKAEITPGNRMKMAGIQNGIMIHDI